MLAKIVVGCIRVAVAQVVRDRIVKEIRLLRNDADIAPQRLERDRSHVVSVDEHAALLRIVKTRHELRYRRLPGA